MNEIQFNKEQKDFIKAPLDDCKLLGIPGGGKTTTIIYKIIHLHALKELESAKEYMVLTFSKKACKDFIAKGNNIDKNKFNNNSCKTFHSLAGTIIQTLLKRNCHSLQTTIISAINVLKINTIENIKKVKCISNLKVLIVDEAQDMSDIQYELISLVKQKIGCKLILVGDPNQNIYQFQNGSDKFLMEYSGKSYILRENNRSTPEIISFINSFRPLNQIMPHMTPIRKSLKKVPTIFCGSHAEILTKILHEIKTFNGLLEDIAIIGPVKKSTKTKDGSYIKFGLQAIANMLTSKNIPFQRHYNDTTDDQEIINTDINIEKNKVNLFTIHGSKGLEFRKVIILNFHTATFGCKPTQEQYNHFKYLWYVALSRAKDELFICVDYGKNVWYELKECNEKLYKVEGKSLTIKEPVFDVDREAPFNIFELVNTKKYFNEQVLLDIVDNINFSKKKIKLYDVQHNDGHEDEIYDDIRKYSGLFNNFLKNIFEYYYSIFHLKELRYVVYISNFVKNLIILDNKYINTLKNFQDKLGIENMESTTLGTMINLKHKFNRSELKLYDTIFDKVTELNKKHNDKFSLSTDNDDVFLDIECINNICTDILECKLNTENEYIWNLFKLCLFEYQYQHESKYLWDKHETFRLYIDGLDPYIKKIKMLAILTDKKYSFCKKVTHPNFNIGGTIDMMTKGNKIIMLKFCDTIDATSVIATYMLYCCNDHKWISDKVIEIWNLKTGYKYIYSFKPIINNFEFLIKLSKITQKKLLKMIFVYDLETTGLDTDICRIIERYMHELSLDVCVSSGVINPNCKIDKIVHEITGITLKEIKSAEFIDVFITEMTEIKQYCHMPTFIAHNGNCFDHKILRRLGIIDESSNTLDSRVIIRQLSESNIGNANLSQIYKIIMGHEYEFPAHRAKADVMMLLNIFEKLCIDANKLLLFIE